MCSGPKNEAQCEIHNKIVNQENGAQQRGTAMD